MNLKLRSQAFPAPYRQLQNQLAQTGWSALGSLVERSQPGQGGFAVLETRRRQMSHFEI